MKEDAPRHGAAEPGARRPATSIRDAPLAANRAVAQMQMQTRLHDLDLRDFGVTDYLTVWEAMRAFTASRDAHSADALWLTEHRPVFTQGQAGRAEHVLDAGAIPLVASDRGGQVTYHGPGQIVAYVLFDLARHHVGIRVLVRLLEAAVISLLADHGIRAEGRIEAPGVYVAEAKIASIGLRVRHGRTYHGVALNVDMDLEPFSRINPCGFAGLAVTDARRLGIHASIAEIKQAFTEEIAQRWQALIKAGTLAA